MLDRLESEIEMLERHLEVLNAVVVGEPIGISKLSEMTGHSKYKVRYSLRILEQEGLIEPSPQGAVTTESVSKASPMLKTKLKEMQDTISDIMKELG